MKQSLSISLRITAALASLVPVLALLTYTRSLSEVTPPATPVQAEATAVQSLSPIVVTAKRTGREAKAPAKASTAGA
jgi:hypothetical protein